MPAHERQLFGQDEAEQTIGGPVAESREPTPEVELTWPTPLAGESRDWVRKAIEQGALREREECARLAEARGASQVAADIRARPSPSVLVRDDEHSPAEVLSPTALLDQRVTPRWAAGGRTVMLSEADAHTPAFSGRLIDYSEGGVGILIDRSLSQGAFLDARPADEPGTAAARLQVRYCISTGTGWRIGCQFVGTPRQVVMSLVGLSPPRERDVEAS